MTNHAATAAITRTGAVTESRISRRLSVTICRTCKQPVLRALDADICAFDVTVDPDPVNELGEALAVAGNRRTYDLTRTRTGLEIEPRRAHHISRPRAYPVLAEHRCGQPLPTQQAAADERTSLGEPPF